MLVGLGAFFVFNSFASSGAVESGSPHTYVNGQDVFCYRGYCDLDVGHGNQAGRTCIELPASL